MENQETWDPTFPAGYTPLPENSYEGSDDSRPAPKTAYPKGRNAVDVSTAAASAAAVTAAD